MRGAVILYGIIVILVCMQDEDENEESRGFVGGICERTYNWGFRHPWIARPFWYFALLVVVLGVCYGAFNYFNLCHTDADSARYMLSAMVQAQAAIIAIVITLTLIAVQLTASTYSPRVIGIFKNNPDMWILLGFYVVSMLYGLVVLKIVEGGAGEAVGQDVFWSRGFVSISPETCISLAYWLEAFTLVALFPYMLNIIGLLKPENIIKRLAIKITKDRILKPKEDPIQPIMDIIHGAVMKYDIATTRVGLDAVTDRVIKIIDSNFEVVIAFTFHYHLVGVGKLAVSKMDKRSTSRVIKNIKNFGKSAAERGLEDAARHAAWALRDVGMTSAERGLEDTVSDATASLESIGKVAEEKGLDDATLQVAESIGYVGISATKKGLEPDAWYAAWSLAKLTISSEEIVKVAIQRLEPNKQDRKSFDKFMKLYEQQLKAEQQLEELRTRNPN